MPLETVEDKKRKITAILNIISHYHLGYVLIDENNPINKDNRYIIKPLLREVRREFTFIILKDEMLNEFSVDVGVFNIYILKDEEIMDFTIGGDEPITPKKKTKKKKEKAYKAPKEKKESSFSLPNSEFLQGMKENLTVFQVGRATQ